MKINPNDRYIDHFVVLNNMDEESKKRLQDDAVEHYGNPWELSLKDFFALAKGDLSYIGLTKETQLNGSVRQYAWMLAFQETAMQVANTLKRLQVPQSDDAKRASEFCLKVEAQEGAIVFARRYFGLHSFAEAEYVTIADFIIAKKDDFNSAMFQHAFNEIQRQSFNKKK